MQLLIYHLKGLYSPELLAMDSEVSITYTFPPPSNLGNMIIFLWFLPRTIQMPFFFFFFKPIFQFHLLHSTLVLYHSFHLVLVSLLEIRLQYVMFNLCCKILRRISRFFTSYFSWSWVHRIFCDYEAEIENSMLVSNQTVLFSLSVPRRRKKQNTTFYTEWNVQ